MATSFPNQWGHIVVIEDQMRSERWETLRAKIDNLVEKQQFRGQFNPDRPWEAVFSFSAYGSGEDQWWWNARVDKPCMQSNSTQGAAGRLAGIEGVVNVGFQESVGSVRNTSRPQKKERYAQRRQETINSGRRLDGRHITDRGAKELFG